MKNVLKSVLTFSCVACLAVVSAGCPEKPAAPTTPEAPVTTTTPAEPTMDTPTAAPETGSGTGSGAAVPPAGG
ncbi:hypothetical protein [Lacunimicrobium album]